MILAKVLLGGEARWTIVEGDSLFAIDGDVYGEFTGGRRLGALTEAKLLAPADPVTIICCGLNYYDTLEQLQIEVPKEPALFYKPCSALVNPGDDTCTIPAISDDPRYEAPNGLHIQGRVNGEIIQDGNTSNQIFSTARIISHVSQFVPLEPGDVVFTGTPKGGHHPVKVGDVIEVEIDGIGVLKNTVAAA